MRFITEFELIPPAIEERINAYKANASFHLGNDISGSLGWKCKGEATLKAIGSELKEKWSLEIEAFPMDKWVDFKKELFEYLQVQEINSIGILEMIKELESFGKPAGAEKEQGNEQEEYGGM